MSAFSRRCGPGVYWERWRIIDAAHLWAKRNGQPPKCDNWRLATEEFPSSCTVRYQFGSWSAMIAAAGFKKTRPGTPTYWTRERIIAGIQLFHAAHGRVPHVREMSQATATLPHWQTVTNVFGTHGAAVRAAGFKCPSAGSPVFWTKDRIAAAMLDQLLSMGRWPHRRAWERKGRPDGTPHANTVIARFGSWGAAKRYAGYVTPAEIEEQDARRRERRARYAARRAAKSGPAIPTPSSSPSGTARRSGGAATPTKEEVKAA